MTVVKPTAGGYEGIEIPDGLYVLTCEKVIDISLPTPDKFGKTEKVRLELSGVTPDGERFTIEPLMNQTFSAFPGKTPSTLFTYADAFGCNPEPDQEFDMDDMIGKKLQALIQTEEEPGSWPRIQSYSKVKARGSQQTAPAPSTTPPVASVSVINPDGSLDTTAFWKEVKRLGFTRESVAAAWDGDVENMIKADPIDVAAWLQEVTEKEAG